MCVPVLDSHPSNSTVVTAEGVSVHYAKCLRDKFWFERVGLKTCLANVLGCLKTVRTLVFARIIPSLRYFGNTNVFVVILLKNFDGCFGEWRCGIMPIGKRNVVFMEMLRILCLEFAFAVLLAFIVCLVGGLLFMVVG